MSADQIIPALFCGLMAGLSYMYGRRAASKELHAANTDLRERISIVTGQLADERARLALRVNRAHEGACKAAKTRKALRIKLPGVVTESTDNQLAASPL